MIRNHAASFLIFAAVIFALAASPSARAADEVPDDLPTLDATFDRDIEFATRPIRDSYLSRLEALNRSIGSRGDVRAALAVQEEIDRVKELSAVTMNGFSGRWTVRYDNNTVRKVTIDTNDVATMLEENDLPKNVKAKLAVKAGEGVIDWGDGTVERLTLVSGKLMIDHFNPKTLYPNGPPSAKAVGTKGTAK